MSKRFRLRLQVQAVDENDHSLSKMDFYSGPFNKAEDIEKDLVSFLHDCVEKTEDYFEEEIEVEVPDFQLPDLMPVLDQVDDIEVNEVVAPMETDDEQEILEKRDANAEDQSSMEDAKNPSLAEKDSKFSNEKQNKSKNNATPLDDSNDFDDDEMDFSDEENAQYDFGSN